MVRRTYFFVLALPLFATVLSGCVQMALGGGPRDSSMRDSMAYVRQHKGEGVRTSLVGTEAELMESAVKILESGGIYTIVREPHAVLAKSGGGLSESTSAFYFHPSPIAGQTIVETLIAARVLDAATIDGFQKSAAADFFQFGYLNARLLDPAYDPNAKDGSMLALSRAAMYGYRGTAKKLLGKGADLESARTELKRIASSHAASMQMADSGQLGKHAESVRVQSRRGAAMCTAGLELLDGLEQVAQENESRAMTEARFQEAFRAISESRPELPESARRFKVQAEDAVRDHKLGNAADLYRQGLEVSPLWPEGRYNRALVLGELGSYESAIAEMKRYLLLAPAAPNARTAQDKIYVWERKAGEEK